MTQLLIPCIVRQRRPHLKNIFSIIKWLLKCPLLTHLSHPRTITFAPRKEIIIFIIQFVEINIGFTAFWHFDNSFTTSGLKIDLDRFFNNPKSTYETANVNIRCINVIISFTVIVGSVNVEAFLEAGTLKICVYFLESSLYFFLLK